MLDNNSLFSILIKGGPMQIFIGLTSIVSFAIIFERFYVYFKTFNEIKLIDDFVRNYLNKGTIDLAENYFLENESPIANLVINGVEAGKLGKERALETMETEGKLIVYELEKGLSTLATISAVAPLLGFLGTVTGMITAFMKIESLQGLVNPSDLAGGIWEALITTATGLSVGIISLGFYNFFLSKVKKIVLQLENIVNTIVNNIPDPED